MRASIELSKRVLKRFPLLVAYNQKGEFVGVTIFKPKRSPRREKTVRTKSRHEQMCADEQLPVVQLLLH